MVWAQEEEEGHVPRIPAEVKIEGRREISWKTEEDLVMVCGGRHEEERVHNGQEWERLTAHPTSHGKIGH